jgi:arsenate reductase (thioredoxin)
VKALVAVNDRFSVALLKTQPKPNMLRQTTNTLLALIAMLTTMNLRAEDGNEAVLIDPLKSYVNAVAAEANFIPEDRKPLLNELAEFVAGKASADAPSRLTFICTHNSRRSHMSQLWSQVAAAYYGIPQVETFSGGTEATACNIRTVRALRRAGFSVVDSTGGGNPVYLVQYSEERPVVKAFSKVYGAEGNPNKDFAAVMTCSSADKNCPIVMGSAVRVAIPYIDPKVSDGTDAEDATYDERLRQVATEQFYVMAKARQLLVEK